MHISNLSAVKIVLTKPHYHSVQKHCDAVHWNISVPSPSCNYSINHRQSEQRQPECPAHRCTGGRVPLPPRMLKRRWPVPSPGFSSAYGYKSPKCCHSSFISHWHGREGNETAQAPVQSVSIQFCPADC